MKTAFVRFAARNLHQSALMPAIVQRGAADEHHTKPETVSHEHRQSKPALIAAESMTQCNSGNSVPLIVGRRTEKAQ